MIIEEIEFIVTITTDSRYYGKMYLQLIDMGRFKLQRVIGTDIQ